MPHPWFRAHDGVLTVTLHVQPGAKCTGIVGPHGDALKIKLAAQPVEGKANEVLLRYIAGRFAVPLSNVALKQGGQSRHKVVAVSGSKIEPESLLTGV